jgi:putative salt-induced outer membrane protein YdiY
MDSSPVKQRFSGRNLWIAVVTLSVLVAGHASVQAGEEKPWDRNIALGLSVSSGNSDSILFNGAIKGDKLWPNDELHLGVDGAYGKSGPDHQLTAAFGHGAAQYNHLFSERLYGFVLADFLHDEISKLSYRVTLSPGAGYYLIKEEATKLALEASPAVVFEKYRHESRHNYIALRIADRFEHKFNDRAKIWQMTEWLPQVDDFSNYKLNTEVGVEAALTTAMSLRVVGQDRYVSQPPPGLKHNDILLTSQLAYKF